MSILKQILEKRAMLVCPGCGIQMRAQQDNCPDCGVSYGLGMGAKDAPDMSEEKEEEPTADFKLDKIGRKIKASKIIFNQGEDDSTKKVQENMKTTYKDIITVLAQMRSEALQLEDMHNEELDEKTAPWETDAEAAKRKKEDSNFKKPSNPARSGMETAKALAQKGLKKANANEELKGKQHKIDKNKNGKIDAHDFKLLRKEEQIDELSTKTLAKAAHAAADPESDYAYGKSHDAQKFADHAKKTKDAKSAAAVQGAADAKGHYPRDNHTHGYDKLANRTPARVTSAGKANKQDVNRLKGNIQRNEEVEIDEATTGATKLVHTRTGKDGAKYHIMQDSPTDYSIHREHNGKTKHIDTYGSLHRAKTVLDNEVKEEVDESHIPDHMKGKQKPYVSSDGKGGHEVLGNTGQVKATFSQKEHGKDAKANAIAHLKKHYDTYLKEEDMNEELHPDADKVLKHIKPEHHAKYTPDLTKKHYTGNFADRNAVLKAAERAGHLKESWADMVADSKRRSDAAKTQTSTYHDVKKTSTGTVYTKQFDKDGTSKGTGGDAAAKAENAPKRGRGRPKKDKFAESVEMLMSLSEDQFDSMMEEGFDAFFEAYEQLDELSKKTLGSYVKKASSDIRSTAFSSGSDHASGEDMKHKDKMKYRGRIKNVEKAVDRLTKEEAEELDELSKTTLGDYAKKASRDSVITRKIAADFEHMSDRARTPGMKQAAGVNAQHYKVKSWKRRDGVDKAIDKLTK